MKVTEQSKILSSFSKLQQLRDLVESPHLRIMRDMEQQQKYMQKFTSPLIDVARDYA